MKNDENEQNLPFDMIQCRGFRCLQCEFNTRAASLFYNIIGKHNLFRANPFRIIHSRPGRICRQKTRTSCTQYSCMNYQTLQTSPSSYFLNKQLPDVSAIRTNWHLFCWPSCGCKALPLSNKTQRFMFSLPKFKRFLIFTRLCGINFGTLCSLSKCDLD